MILDMCEKWSPKMVILEIGGPFFAKFLKHEKSRFWHFFTQTKNGCQYPFHYGVLYDRIPKKCLKTRFLWPPDQRSPPLVEKSLFNMPSICLYFLFSKFSRFCKFLLKSVSKRIYVRWTMIRIAGIGFRFPVNKSSKKGGQKKGSKMTRFYKMCHFLQKSVHLFITIPKGPGANFVTFCNFGKFFSHFFMFWKKGVPFLIQNENLSFYYGDIFHHLLSKRVQKRVIFDPHVSKIDFSWHFFDPLKNGVFWVPFWTIYMSGFLFQRIMKRIVSGTDAQKEGCF